VHVLHGLPRHKNANVIVGTETSDDAGVFRLRADLAIVNTVDFFTPIVDDPYVFGQIAAANAFSDIYAMGAEPRTALNIVAFPKGTLPLEVLGEIIRGGAERARRAGAVVIGGHSIIDPELKYGMAVTGVVHPKQVIRNVGVRAGDALVLTKPLGTGIIATALKQRVASALSVRRAVASMIALNDAASTVMRRFKVHACSARPCVGDGQRHARHDSARVRQPPSSGGRRGSGGSRIPDRRLQAQPGLSPG
jgi:selenide,water dikinase